MLYVRECSAYVFLSEFYSGPVSHLGLSSILSLCFCMELKSGGKPGSYSGGQGCAQQNFNTIVC